MAATLWGGRRQRVRSWTGDRLVLRRTMHGAHEMPSRWLVALFLTVPLSDCLAPVKVVEKPPHRRFQALFKCVAGLPLQLVLDQCGVNCVAAVVPGAVAHQGDQARVGSTLGAELIHQGADRLHHLSVIAFPTASYAVAGPSRPRVPASSNAST